MCYSQEASIYSSEIEKIEMSLNEIFSELEEVKKIMADNLNNKDILNYYVNEFNEDIIKETEDLIAKCEKDKVSIVMKAKEIDERILAEKKDSALEDGDKNE